MKALGVVLLALSLQGCQALLVLPAMAVQGAVLVGQAAVTAVAAVGVGVGAGVKAMAEAGEEDKADEANQEDKGDEGDKEDKGIEPATTGTAVPVLGEAAVSDGPGSGQPPRVSAESGLQDFEVRMGTDANPSAAPVVDTPDAQQSTESAAAPAAPQQLAAVSTNPAPAPAPAAAPAPANPLPIEAGGLRQGDRWEYAFIDSRKGRSEKRSYAIEQASANAIVELIELDDGSTLTAEHHGGAYLNLVGGMQFAPYYLAFEPGAVAGPVRQLKAEGGDACETRIEGGGDYAATVQCQIAAEITDLESVTVPAGTFQAQVVRVTVVSEVSGNWSRRETLVEARFWISPETKRIVKAVVRFDAARPWTETMELVSYHVQGQSTATAR